MSNLCCHSQASYSFGRLAKALSSYCKTIVWFFYQCAVKHSPIYSTVCTTNDTLERKSFLLAFYLPVTLPTAHMIQGGYCQNGPPTASVLKNFWGSYILQVMPMYAMLIVFFAFRVYKHDTIISCCLARLSPKLMIVILPLYLKSVLIYDQNCKRIYLCYTYTIAIAGYVSEKTYFAFKQWMFKRCVAAIQIPEQ